MTQSHRKLHVEREKIVECREKPMKGRRRVSIAHSPRDHRLSENRTNLKSDEADLQVELRFNVAIELNSTLANALVVKICVT